MKFERGNLVGGSIKKLKLPSSNLGEPDKPNALVIKSGNIGRANKSGVVLPAPVRRTALYDFISHTFTNANAEGRFGPTLSQCRSAYSNTEWASNTDFFNVSSGIQIWTVPETGIYRIEARGAAGGGSRGGKGARILSDVNLVKGIKVRILVGQSGAPTNQNSNFGAGGGGASFVYVDTDSPLLIAGGGGGQSQHADGGPGSHTQNSTLGIGGSGTGLSAPLGQGGLRGQNIGHYSTGSGGGGWLSNGEVGSYIRNLPGGAGFSPRFGGTGGRSNHPLYPEGDGGFGGGASFSDNSGAGGGGGGYTGGSGANNFVSSQWGAGGGGGSFNSGQNQVSQAGVNTGHGRVTITKL